MAIETEHLRRRLASARELRGYTQAEFNDACAELGLGKTEASRVERGTVEWRAKHSMVFAQALRVPIRWFTEPDDDVVVGLRAPSLSPDDLRVHLEQLAEGIARVQAQSQPGTTTPRVGTGRRPGGSGGGDA